MRSAIFLLFFSFILAGFAAGQQADSLKVATGIALQDSSKISTIAADSVLKPINPAVFFTTQQRILARHPYFNFAEKAAPVAYRERPKTPGKEAYFYILSLLLLLFAAFKTAFAKYFDDLVNLFFRRTLKQRQLRQQVSQNSLPSLLFNIFFVLVAAFYLALVFQSFGYGGNFPFWLLVIYALPVVAVIYVGKYLVLKLVGWMFHVQRVTDGYIFLVFLVNKIITLFLLPLVVIIALGSLQLKTIGFTISWIVLAGIYLYRILISFSTTVKETKINVMHLLLYILAFEIIPVLVIYKAITSFLI